MRQIIQTNQFKRDYKKIASSNRYKKEDFLTVIDILTHDKVMHPKYQDHALIGNWAGYRECHIKSDWLLIYKKLDQSLLLARTGTHSELF